MSESILGSKSFIYAKEDIPANPGTGDTLQHLSVQEVVGKRGAADVVIHGSTTVSTGHSISAGSVRRKIVSAAHGAQRGWIMRPSSGNSLGEEITIVEIIDSNTFAIAYEADLAIADTFDLCKLITPNYTAAGDLNVVVNGSGPVQFVKDSVDVEVEEDTAVPANNKPLPSKMFIEIDGVTYPVSKDTGTPANTVSIPVELSGVSGPVNITAGDLNVQLTDLGANFDRTRIGNGTNQWDMNASGEGLTHDQDVLDELVTLNSVDFATEAKQDSIITELTTLNGNDFATETTQVANGVLLGAVTETAPATDTASSGLNGRLQRIAQRLTSLIALFPLSLGQKTSANSFAVVLASDQSSLSVTGPLTDAELRATPVPVSGDFYPATQPISAASLPLPTGAATEATLAANGVLIGATNETAPGSDTGASGLNGRLQRIAQRLTSLIALFPTSLGQKTMANSFAVTFASDQTGITTTNAVQVGTYDQSLVISNSGVTTLTAPANAKSVKVMAGDANIANLRVTVDGSTPSATRGMQFQAGRSEDFVGVVSLQVIAQTAATNQELYVHWSV